MLCRSVLSSAEYHNRKEMEIGTVSLKKGELVDFEAHLVGRSRNAAKPRVKRGRKSTLTADRMEKLLGCVRRGLSNKDACMVAGIRDNILQVDRKRKTREARAISGLLEFTPGRSCPLREIPPPSHCAELAGRDAEYPRGDRVRRCRGRNPAGREEAAPPWEGEVGEARDSHAPTDAEGFYVAARASVP